LPDRSRGFTGLILAALAIIDAFIIHCRVFPAMLAWRCRGLRMTQRPLP
jgi:hypothetical protein